MFVDCIGSDLAGVPLPTLGGSVLRREVTQLWPQLRPPSDGDRESEYRPQLSGNALFLSTIRFLKSWLYSAGRVYVVSDSETCLVGTTCWYPTA